VARGGGLSSQVKKTEETTTVAAKLDFGTIFSLLSLLLFRFQLTIITYQAKPHRFTFFFYFLPRHRGEREERGDEKKIGRKNHFEPKP
jgi:hypothetical protein